MYKDMVNCFKNLFILEMANNHMGDVEHGLRIIREFYEICKDYDFQFAFKFQFRHLDTFIHPDYKNRFDFKYIKRFSETRLSPDDFKKLKQEVDNLGFISICTPFDEKSVDLIEELNFDIIKVASCSFTDWPLLERIVKTDKPIIASTAGVSLEDIDKVVSFFEHRNKKFALMHCVAEYPTKKENLHLNQIDLLKKRYPNIPVGYSTHEHPENYDSIKIAIAKGATIFEKHVGIETDKYKLNQYSAKPEQVKKWLDSAKATFEMCGVSETRYPFTEDELRSLHGLRRGVFALRDIKTGEKITQKDIFLAIPLLEKHLTANDLSKYADITALNDIKKNAPILLDQIRIVNNRDRIYEIVQKVKALIKESKVVVPGKAELEISHHYGIDKFEEYGMTMITVVNRDYCKKLLILLPGQKNPEHYHKMKDETFHVLYGTIEITLDDEQKKFTVGDVIVVEKGVKHSLMTKTGAIVEEISSTHYKEDSFYTDQAIMQNKNRKTLITYWMD